MNFNSNGTSYPCKSKVEGEVIGVSIITNQRKKKKAKMLMDIVFVLISFSVCVFVCALSHAKRKKILNYLYNKYAYSCVFLVVGLFLSRHFSFCSIWCPFGTSLFGFLLKVG